FYTDFIAIKILTMYAYQKQFFNIKSWNLTWILFMVSVFLAFIRGTLFRKELRFLTVAIGLIFLAHISIYIMSPGVEEDLRTLSRLLLHFLPLVIFFIARVFALGGGLRYDKGSE
ncbi:MAG: hypothetical protein NTX47_05300, partial [Candidatus Omnitrophica bacterium]|nr:hypothetical protein [Candidatus Omnitrophota bacterium]